MQESLHDRLHEWEVKPAPSPNFRAAVWRRIAERKQRPTFRIWNRTEQVVGQPAWATALVAALLLAGAASGNAWREHSVQHDRAAGLNAYVLAVNPIAHAAMLRR